MLPVLQDCDYHNGVIVTLVLLTVVRAVKVIHAMVGQLVVVVVNDRDKEHTTLVSKQARK